MSFNYLTNSSGITRIAAYVERLVDGAVDGHIEKLSQKLRADRGRRFLKRDLSEVISRTIIH